MSAADLPLGLRYDMPIEAYHSGDGISKSGLDDIERSPWHFKRMRSPDAPAREETPAQLLGNITHAAILEPTALADRYPVGPAGVTRAHKDWKAFEASLKPHQTGVKPEDMKAALARRDSVVALPEARAALARGVAEISAYWTDVRTGVLCRVRPDWVHTPNEGQSLILDVKTTGSADPQEFVRQIAQQRYHCQHAMYVDGYAAAANVEVLGFFFVTVEASFPYAASCVMLDDDSVEVGRRAYQRNLATYAECLRTDTWPGYSSAIELVSLPRWAKEDRE